MTGDENGGGRRREDAKALHQAVTALARRLEEISDALSRMEGRLDVLYDECQRTGGASERMLMRQEGLAKKLDRLRETLEGK